MDWKRNKLVGIVMGIVAIICISIALIPFVQRAREKKIAEEQIRKLIEDHIKEDESWKDRFIWDEKGRIIGEKGVTHQ